MKLAYNSLYSLLGMAVPVLVSLATVPLFIAQIGAERYGALAIAWLVLGYFGAADFGIGRAITHRIAELGSDNRVAKADAVYSALLSIAGFGCITAVVLFVFAQWYFAGPFKVDDGLRPEIVRAVWVLALCSPAVAINGVLAGAIMGLERFRLVAVSNTISNSGLLLLPLAVAYFIRVDLTLLIAAALVARLVGSVILGAGVWHAFLKGHPITFSRDEFASLAKFGAWIMVSALLGPVMVFADRLLIGVLIDAAAVAAYAIPMLVAARTMLIPTAISQALFPRFAAEGEESSRMRCGQFSAFIGQIFAPIIILLVCLAEPLLSVWLGGALDPRSVLIGQIILLGYWTNAIAIVPFAFLQARGQTRYTAMLHVAELPFYLALLWLLGIQFGLAGFALTFSIRTTIECAILLRKAALCKTAVIIPLVPPAILIALATLAGLLLTDVAILVVIALVLSGAAILVSVVMMPQALRPGFARIGWIVAPGALKIRLAGFMKNRGGS